LKKRNAGDTELRKKKSKNDPSLISGSDYTDKHRDSHTETQAGVMITWPVGPSLSYDTVTQNYALDGVI